MPSTSVLTEFDSGGPKVIQGESVFLLYVQLRAAEICSNPKLLQHLLGPSSFSPENRGTMFQRNIRLNPHNHLVSKSRRMQSEKLYVSLS